jgi:hypothetical protein
MEEGNKFTESEIVVGSLFALGVDGICGFIDFTGVGLGISPVIQGFAIFAIDKWVGNKGGITLGVGKQMTQYAAGILPVLPTTTAVFAIRVFVHNNPKIAKVATRAAGPAGKIAGKLKKVA